MTAIPDPLDAHTETGLLEALARWLPTQRWYTGKGAGDVDLHLDGQWPLPPAEAAHSRAQVWVLVVTATSRSTDYRATYQIPVVLRPDQDEEPTDPTTVGVLVGPGDVRRRIVDGPHDPAFTAAWWPLVAQGAGLPGPHGHPLRGSVQPGGAPLGRPRGARVLGGEQSNTSIVYDLYTASDSSVAGIGSGSSVAGVIVKVFRVLHEGDNPDVLVQSALTLAGCDRVPTPIGWVEGRWNGTDGRGLRGHLGFASEFLAGTRDAWRVATEAVAAGIDGTDGARGLGAATATVHRAMAEALDRDTATDAPTAAEIVTSLRERLDWAVAAVPDALGPHREAISAVVDDVAALAASGDLPAPQRIHGDYHLGQVLLAPGRGWILLDFEGEPLRPLAERTRPDLALRDVAGMLRSFDYAAHAGAITAADSAPTPETGTSAPGLSETDRRTWARACSDAFCAGYAQVAGRNPLEDGALLRALTLDKAVYEVVYESRNRPDWLQVPLHAVRRLLGPAPTDDAPTDHPPRPTDREETPVTTEPPASPAPPDAIADGPTPLPVDHGLLTAVAHGLHHDPHAVLGPHPHEGGVTLRVLRPMARSVVAVLDDGTRVDLSHEHEGVWVAVLPRDEVGDYRVEVGYDGAHGVVTSTVDDPYRFLPTLGEIDLHLVAEGRHEQLWTVLGAQQRRYDGPMGEVAGTSFAVWAPRARAVRLIGDPNHWVGTTHAMRSLGSSGVWELFVPGVGPGTRYKYEIQAADGSWQQKADPMAFGTELPPSTASVVVSDEHRWGDQEWMTRRAQTDPHAGPMSAYEVHLGSWREGLSYRDLAEQLVDYVRDNGFTHVELMPVAEHPFGGSWGYQVTSYYAPTSRFGHPDDFRHLVDRLHQAGIGVILDWVPAHFPKDAWALASFDGQPLYEHPDPRRGEQKDWGTLVPDYGRPQVRNFFVANALFWLEEFHIDGLRVDAVASMLYLDYSRQDGEWLPNQHGGREHLEAIEFLQETNATVYRRCPGVVMIAEESTAWPGVTRPTHLGGLGFGMKWNMGWMHDSLGYMAEDPVHRQYHHHRMTFSLMYAFSENFVLPISHDEVVHGKGSLLRKMPGDRWKQLASVRAYLAYMWAHPGKQLLFMGSEFAQEAEWADSRSLDWWLLDQPAHSGVQSLVRDLNRTYTATESLWQLDSDPAGFEWIDANDSVHNTFSFVRRAADGTPLVCVVNFAGEPHEDYRVGLPSAGRWTELLNTDAEIYGGSGVGNLGEVEATDQPWHGMPASTTLRVPPLGALWFVPA